MLMINNEDETYDSLLDKLDNYVLSNNITQNELDKIKLLYQTQLNKREKSGYYKEINEEDITPIYEKFCNYTTINLLLLVLKKIYSDDNETINNYLNVLIEDFMQEIKTSFYRNFELLELKRQNTKLVEIIGKDTLDKELMLLKQRINKIIEKTDTYIKNILNVENDTKGIDYDET